MATIEITTDNIKDVIAGNNMVILDFWASWCGPCRSFAPTFEAASEKYPDIVFGKVNTEEQQELAAYFETRSIPTVMLFREAVRLFSQAGALPAAGIDSIIEQARKIDMAAVHKEVADQEAREAADPKPE